MKNFETWKKIEGFDTTTIVLRKCPSQLACLIKVLFPEGLSEFPFIIQLNLVLFLKITERLFRNCNTHENNSQL